MTSEPSDPGAAAVYLLRDERADDKLHYHTVYVRLKILTEAGKQYADVEIPYEGRHFSIQDVEGRTIHSDGTVIPLTGKPYQKMLVKSKTLQYKATVFTMPDVQVGSILEYRYQLRYDDNEVLSPQWYVQQDMFLRKAHYLFIPYERGVVDKHGNISEDQLAYVALLPAGAAVKHNEAAHTYELDIANVPPAPKEEFMPPIGSVTDRVLFYYTPIRKVDDFWKEEGKYWSKDVDRFAAPGKLGPIVAQIVGPSDNQKQKLQKIYAAVMKLENTSFTREHSEAENKAQGIKIKTAEDIWNQKRGNSDEITLLFIGLARAAGFQAYAMDVTNRDRALFMEAYLNMDQLDDDIAIVTVDGKEQYFDPGQRYCPFGQLHWKHTVTQGLRQTDHGPEIASTSGPGAKSTQILRSAFLELAPNGALKGQIRINMTGSEALKWRQIALESDAEEAGKEFQNYIQQLVPRGVEVKMGHFLALEDYENVLMTVLDVSGSMGTATSKRVFLPTMFFEGGSKPLFVHDKRTLPVDLKYPYMMQDQVSITLPKELAVESLPKDADIPLPQGAAYSAKYKQSGQTLTMTRLMILASAFYAADAYPPLKDFYQKVSSKDQEQAVLHPGPANEGAKGE